MKIIPLCDIIYTNEIIKIKRHKNNVSKNIEFSMSICQNELDLESSYAQVSNSGIEPSLSENNHVTDDTTILHVINENQKTKTKKNKKCISNIDKKNCGRFSTMKNTKNQTSNVSIKRMKQNYATYAIRF